MIIKNYELKKDNILNKNFFLFYGENEGYKNQIIEKIILDNKKFKVTKYDESEILENRWESLSSVLSDMGKLEEKQLSIGTEAIKILMGDNNVLLDERDLTEKKNELSTKKNEIT